ncbi:PAS domain S-box protein [Nostoc sp. FACHB-110]|uniref:PAS domain S-box protein n=1 Tax=Nostoc sp. FACHB-110 TaxID=2692834 RepID=UPI0016829941|nr:PAS domain S-box protein [Nostoc sp. FACHB-110]MBD2441577.1 PAS domain S-box protein [Nostoc sp. FACHB-110]
MKNGSPLSVLLIDDCEIDCMNYCRYLLQDKLYTYNTSVVATAKQATTWCQQQTPDVILLDYRLPDSNGIEFLQALRQSLNNNQSAVIMLTGTGDETIAVNVMKNGAQDYLVKDHLTASILQSAIHQAVERTRLSQQVEQTQKQQQLMAAIALRIRQSLNLNETLATITKEVQQFLQVDRVLIYQLNPDIGGTVVAESVLEGWTVTLGTQIEEQCFLQNYQANYLQGKKRAINDIYQANLTDCHLQLLEKFEVKANLVVPIVVTNQLWGLLIAHQCSAARCWETFELDLLDHLGGQIAIAIQQATAYQQAQQELVQRRQTEKILRQNEARFQAFMNNSPSAAWITDEHGQILYLSQTYLRTFQLPSDQVEHLIGQTLYDIYPPEIAQKFLHNIRQVVQTQQILETIEKVPKSDGTIGDFLVYKFLLPETTGPLLVGGVALDISDKIIAEQALQKLNQELEARVAERTAALKESEERWHLALRGSNDGIWDWNMKTNEVFFSTRWEEMLGFNPHELAQNEESWSSRIHPDDSERVFMAIADHLAHKTAFFQEEYRVQCKDGSYIWILDRGQALWDDAGNPIRMNGSATDVTQRKQTEAELLAVSGLQQAILASIDYAIITTDSEGIIQTFNAAAEKMLGYTADEVIGRVQINSFHDPQEIKQRIDELGKELGRQVFPEDLMAKFQQNTGESEWTFIRKDGSSVPVALSVKPMFNLEGQMIGGVGIAKDITQQKQLEAQLRKNAANLNAAQRIAHLGSWELDLPTQNLIWSEELFRIFGRNHETGTPSYSQILSCIHPEDRDRYYSVLQQAISQKQAYEMEYRFYRPDGSLGYLLSRGEVIFDNNNQPYQLIGTILDITNRKQTEEKLRNLSDRLTLALKSANIGTWDWDTVHTAEWDERMYELYSLKPADGIDLYQDWLQRLHPEDRHLAESALRDAIQGIKEFDAEFRIILNDGSIRYIKASAIVQRNEQGQAQRMVGINYDITEHKQAEAALRDSEHRYATLTDTAPVAIFRLDVASNCIYVNERWSLMTGRPTQAALGKGWLENIHPQDQEQLQKNCLILYKQACEISEACRREVKYLRPDGQITWFYIQIVPETNPIGTVIGYIGTLTDITIRKQIESEVIHHRDLREAIFNESADALFLVDSQTRLTFDCNSRAVELFEASSKQELINIEGNLLQRYQFTTEELAEIVEEIEQKSYWSREIEYVTCKGNFFWGNLATKQITVAGKKINLVRLSDISDRKKAVQQIQRSLEEKETLLKEIHHRVKNNLQIISSLLRMQSRRSEDEATLLLFTESQNRVQSMALIHEQLYQSADIHQINFSSYIKTLTDSLFRCYGVSQKNICLHIETNGINLNLDNAIPCGLIINELVSNCLKYAFPLKQTGNIIILLKEAPESKLMLIIKDNGIGIPENLDWENASSLGLRIVKNLVRQLKGNIILERDRGTSFYIHFPQSV